MENEVQPLNTVVQPEPKVVAASSTSWIKIVLFVVLGIALLAGAVFAGMQIGKTQAPAQQPVVLEPPVKPTQVVATPTAVVSPSALPTVASPSAAIPADWKTYSNTENQYSIQYPKSFLRLICPDEELTLRTRSAAEVMPGPIEMQTCARGGRYSLETKTFATNQAIPMGDSQFYTIDEKTITLGGKPAKQFTFTFKNNADGPYPTWYTIVRADSKGKTFEVYYDNKDSVALFDQILSTFKFTD